MTNFNNEILKDIFYELKDIFHSLKIPARFNMIYSVKFDKRVCTKLGCCKIRAHSINIVMSTICLALGKEEIRNTLAHEILHTIEGCDNHDERFHHYANILNNSMNGLKIVPRVEFRNIIKVLGEDMRKLHYTPYKYIAKCAKCGEILMYFSKKTEIVKYPELFNCNACGGDLKIIPIY